MDEAFAHAAEEKGLKKGLPAPDGGWGYLVCVGVGLTFMLGFGSSSAFGILFHDFFKEDGGASGLTLVIGVYNGALSIAGLRTGALIKTLPSLLTPFFGFVLSPVSLTLFACGGFISGIALKKYSFRQVGLIGAGLFVLGDLLTIFVMRTYQLVFTFGLIRGAGFGTMIPVSYTAFNSYFIKKRTAMMSANQTMSSLASITFPLLVTFLLAEYGFRWTLTLILAVDLHVFFAMLVMHPVEWHLKAEAMEGNKDEDNKTNKNGECVEVVAVMAKKVENHEHKSIQKSIIKTICANVELDLLKDPRFLSTLIGLGFAFVSDVTYLALEPMLLFSYNFTKIQVATCVMVGAIADLLARFLLAVVTYFYDVDSRKLFFAGTCVTVFLRIALVSCSNVTYIFVVTAVSGLFRCTVQVLFPLVLAGAAPERFPAALALHIIFSGVLMFIADPLIGVIYEVSGSYVYCFLAMSVCCLICVVLWTIDFIVYRGKVS